MLCIFTVNATWRRVAVLLGVFWQIKMAKRTSYGGILWRTCLMDEWGHLNGEDVFKIGKIAEKYIYWGLKGPVIKPLEVTLD